MRNLLKLFNFAIMLLASSQSHSSTIALGDPEQFEAPFEVAATIVERVDSLLYWAMPLEVDEEGIKQLKAFISKSRSNNYMASPLLFQFRIAGLKDGQEEGLDLSQDGFSEILRDEINRAFEGKTVLLTCYGAFKAHIVPYCSAVDENNKNPAITLIASGLLLPDSTKGKVPALMEKEFTKSIEKAKAEKKGVWKPFHSMFRGIR